MRLGDDLCRRDHGSRRHTVVLQNMHRCIVVASTGPGGENVIQRSLVLPTPRQCGKSNIVSQLGLTDGVTKAAPLSIGADGDGHPQIVALAGIDAVRRHEQMPVGDGRCNPSRERVIHHRLT
jgi:hypothetical protein